MITALPHIVPGATFTTTADPRISDLGAVTAQQDQSSGYRRSSIPEALRLGVCLEKIQKRSRQVDCREQSFLGPEEAGTNRKARKESWNETQEVEAGQGDRIADFAVQHGQRICRATPEFRGKRLPVHSGCRSECASHRHALRETNICSEVYGALDARYPKWGWAGRPSQVRERAFVMREPGARHLGVTLGQRVGRPETPKCGQGCPGSVERDLTSRGAGNLKTKGGAP